MRADGQSGEAVILPLSGSGRTIKLTMKIGNGMKITFTKKLADGWEFKAGTRYTFPIKLKRPSPTAPVEEITAEGTFEGEPKPASFKKLNQPRLRS
jgi:hypothetical protein